MHRPHGREWLRQRRLTAKRPRRTRSTSFRALPASQLYSAEYFTEEVRRELAKLYGEDQLYGGGLSVRTTLDPKLQAYARKALMDGLVDYDRRQGLPRAGGDGRRFERRLGQGGQQGQAAERRAGMDAGRGPGDGQERGQDRPQAGNRCRRQDLGRPRHGHAAGAGDQMGLQAAFATCSRSAMLSMSRRSTDKDGVYTLQQVPEIEGALVAMDPRTGPRAGHGRRLLLRRLSEFNRATQAHAAAGILVQADRLFGGARQWLYAGLGGARRSDRDLRTPMARCGGRRTTRRGSISVRRPCAPGWCTRAT